MATVDEIQRIRQAVEAKLNKDPELEKNKPAAVMLFQLATEQLVLDIANLGHVREQTMEALRSAANLIIND